MGNKWKIQSQFLNWQLDTIQMNQFYKIRKNKTILSKIIIIDIKVNCFFFFRTTNNWYFLLLFRFVCIKYVPMYTNEPCAAIIFYFTARIRVSSTRLRVYFIWLLSRENKQSVWHRIDICKKPNCIQPPRMRRRPLNATDFLPGVCSFVTTPMSQMKL